MNESELHQKALIPMSTGLLDVIVPWKMSTLWEGGACALFG